MTRRELAQAMRAAIQRPGVTEDNKCYIELRRNGGCLACALGSALVEHFKGDYNKAYNEYRKILILGDFKWGYQLIGEILGISTELASTISMRHDQGESIESIAQWLESDPDWAEGWEDNINV